MSALKQAELQSRESAVSDVRAFLAGLLERDRERCALLRVAHTEGVAAAVSLAATHKESGS